MAEERGLGKVRMLMLSSLCYGLFSYEGIKSLQLTCAEILARPLESQHMELPGLS